ncbi:hypothetical protein [Picosynechococcus sp. NKBG15041c]|uniref:hypothetical protein n=1 Tax=Picosynechococcus sp. NKBG15041c TaxID=1407650 RepID=UPI000464DC29|nr:hypothetical protein [Picosynechococcus sp. NKBG15041c]
MAFRNENQTIALPGPSPQLHKLQEKSLHIVGASSPQASIYSPLQWSKTMKLIQSIGGHLLDGLLISSCLLLSNMTGAIATPSEPIGCPEGWIPYTQELSPRISVCVPKQITLPIPADLGHQPARVQVQQLRIIQTNSRVSPTKKEV